MGLIYAVNCGAGDLDGYVSDSGFLASLGDSYTDGGAINTSLLTDVPSQGVLQSYRYLMASNVMTFNAGSLNNVPHTVRMFLWSDGGVGTQDITINGVLAADNLNVASEAGSTYKAIQRDYAVTPSANTISIEIFANSGYSLFPAFKIIEDSGAPANTTNFFQFLN